MISDICQILYLCIYNELGHVNVVPSSWNQTIFDLKFDSKLKVGWQLFPPNSSLIGFGCTSSFIDIAHYPKGFLLGTHIGFAIILLTQGLLGFLALRCVLSWSSPWQMNFELHYIDKGILCHSSFRHWGIVDDKNLVVLMDLCTFVDDSTHHAKFESYSKYYVNSYLCGNDLSAKPNS